MLASLEIKIISWGETVGNSEIPWPEPFDDELTAGECTVEGCAAKERLELLEETGLWWLYRVIVEISPDNGVVVNSITNLLFRNISRYTSIPELYFWGENLS